jgi:malate dehydrogenase (oxaloacetate-decarboxylating)
VTLRTEVLEVVLPRSVACCLGSLARVPARLPGESAPVSLDCTFRVQIPHQPGQLARVAEAIGAAEGLIGDIATVNLAKKESIREITVEVRDTDHADAIAERVDGLDGIHVLWHRDRALIRHEGGKLNIEPTNPVRTVQDLRDVYTPGVARACTAIANEPALARRYTMIGRSVAVCTNGTRVLGLGDIGPTAAMPVMEGKAAFYRQLAGISAMPVLIEASDPDEFVETVVRIASTFGGIHLEDISAPECFDIERRLIEALPKPVMHDDVHGTAVVALAAAIEAGRQAGTRLDDSVVGQMGLGAAGLGIATLLVEAGAERVLASDPDEDSHERARSRGIEIAETEAIMGEADVVIATTGQPGLIEPDMVRSGQVILALTNPDPEITPEDAEEAGAAFAADGSSVNNLLGYPGIFRGALLAGAEEITVEMKLAAAWAIAGLTAESELVPDALDPEVHQHVAKAVCEAAYSSGVANPDRAPVGL